MMINYVPANRYFADHLLRRTLVLYKLTDLQAAWLQMHVLQRGMFPGHHEPSTPINNSIK